MPSESGEGGAFASFFGAGKNSYAFKPFGPYGVVSDLLSTSSSAGQGGSSNVWSGNFKVNLNSLSFDWIQTAPSNVFLGSDAFVCVRESL